MLSLFLVVALLTIAANCDEEISSDGLLVCSLKPVTGPCEGYARRYFYNTTSKACETFVYGGCRGNGNRFNSKSQCEQSCVVDVCKLPPQTGNCFGYFPKYFFNGTSGLCQRFVYGGCGGNPNKFDTVKDCQKHCAPHRPSFCKLPAVTGNCKAYIPQYFFNSKTGKCEVFIYGGCGGNRNRFNTLAKCRKVCRA